MLRTAVFAAALLALGACASTQESASNQPPADRDCFRNADIFGYTIIDNHNVGVRANGRDYIFTTTWNARSLNWAERIAVRSPTGWICTGNGLGVDVIGGEPARTYPISAITRAPDEPTPTGS